LSTSTWVRVPTSSPAWVDSSELRAETMAAWRALHVADAGEDAAEGVLDLIDHGAALLVEPILRGAEVVPGLARAARRRRRPGRWDVDVQPDEAGVGVGVELRPERAMS
jgi:hypothetical protein